MDQDAFCHHPELENKIADPLSSFFRTFNVESVLEQHPELDWVLELLHSDEDREQSRAQTLADHGDDDLWVFAYGSLMWDPAFQFTEVRHASVPGYSRQFILKDVYGGRGTMEAPGLMAALDHGGSCEGLLFRIAAQDVDAETEILWRREMIGPAYIPTFVTAQIDGTPLRALAFVANHSADQINTEMTRQEQVRYIASGVGFLGTSKDYLANIVGQFATLGIVDGECSELLHEVEAFLSERRDADAAR